MWSKLNGETKFLVIGGLLLAIGFSAAACFGWLPDVPEVPDLPGK